jgi:predicted porin
MQVRFPSYAIIRGKMPTSRGWGDLLINLTRNVVMQEKFRVNLTLGIKIYTSKADKQSDSGASMPMYQQTSYGSNDINFGAAVLTRNWLFAAAYQHPLNQVKNNFSPQAWENDPLQEVVKVYDPSAGLQRGDDFMIRIERNFRFSQFNFFAGMLNLWRVTADKTLNASNQLQEVAGSTGLASNLIVGAGYQFNTRMGVRLLTSYKLKERDANPDGLARDFISQLAYIVRF